MCGLRKHDDTNGAVSWGVYRPAVHLRIVVYPHVLPCGCRHTPANLVDVLTCWRRHWQSALWHGHCQQVQCPSYQCRGLKGCSISNQNLEMLKHQLPRACSGLAHVRHALRLLLGDYISKVSGSHHCPPKSGDGSPANDPYLWANSVVWCGSPQRTAWLLFALCPVSPAS